MESAGLLLSLISNISPLQTADIQACDIHGLTPLHAAATWGHVDIVKLLLSPPSLGGGADREKKDHDGYTPLMVASHNGHSDVVLALLG